MVCGFSAGGKWIRTVGSRFGLRDQRQGRSLAHSRRGGRSQSRRYGAPVAGTRLRPRVLRRIRPGGGVDRARLSREPRIAPAELITGVSAFAASGYARQRCGGTFRELGYVGKTPGTTCASHPRRDARCRWGHVRQEPMALDPAYYAGVPAGGSRAGPAVRPCRCRRAPLAFSAPIMSPQAAFGNTPLRAEVLVDRRDAGIAVDRHRAVCLRILHDSGLLRGYHRRARGDALASGPIACDMLGVSCQALRSNDNASSASAPKTAASSPSPRMPRVAELPPGWRHFTTAQKIDHLIGLDRAAEILS